MPRQPKHVESAVNEFGFEFSEPPARSNTRRGKHFERWEAARRVAEANPGKSLKVLTYNQPSSAYTTAKQINNDEHRQFTDAEKGERWLAVAGPDGTDENPNQHAIWLTFKG